MVKKYFIMVLLLCSTGFLLLAGYQKNNLAQAAISKVYDNWPQVQFKNCRVLLATNPKLASRGFAVASDEDFENTIIIFSEVSEGTMFINRNQGFGAVKKDLKIVFLDSKMHILKQDIMKKTDGYSIAPQGTCFAIEGLPAE